MTESEKLVTIAKNTDRVYRIGRESVLNPNLKYNIVDIKDNNWKYWGQKAMEFEDHIKSMSNTLYIIIHGLFKTDDTKDVIDFGHMFANCNKLTIFPLVNTSNGEIFDYMFYECESMMDAPFLDTSKGRVFRHMFSGCDADGLIIPEYDTSNGEDFLGMFYGCAYLRKLPNLNTSKGENFQQFLDGCWRLAGDYTFDTHKGRNFYAFARNCQQLTGLHINVSGATDLTYAFKNCNKLIDVDLGDGIPVSVSFSNSPKLTDDSAERIVRGLMDYSNDAENRYKHTITFHPDVWEKLSWIPFVVSTWDGERYVMEDIGVDGYLSKIGWLRA